MSPSPTDSSALATAITRELAATPGQFATELARTLKVAKGDVNSLLYKSDQFVRTEDSKP